MKSGDLFFILLFLFPALVLVLGILLLRRRGYMIEVMVEGELLISHGRKIYHVFK